MSQYRSALGKVVDMAQLASRHEHVRAVGNQKVNARGDTIDSNNNVIVPVTKKVGAAYDRTVTNRAANIIRQAAPQQFPVEELLPQEIELEDDNEADEIEAIKAAETANLKIKPASEAPDFVMPDQDVTTTKKK